MALILYNVMIKCITGNVMAIVICYFSKVFQYFLNRLQDYQNISHYCICRYLSTECLTGYVNIITINIFKSIILNSL